MSGLAPFVAAALRDKVVEDLRQENASQAKTITDLKTSICDLSTVLITAVPEQGEVPVVHGKWKLDVDFTTRAWDGFYNTNELKNKEVSKCMPLDQLLHAQIQICGTTHHLCNFKVESIFGGENLLFRPRDDSKLRVMAVVMSTIRGGSINAPFDLDMPASVEELVETCNTTNNDIGDLKILL